MLINKLQQVYNFWKNERRPFDSVLVSVYYNKIVAKSNRIAGLFRGKKSNTAIVGSKFNDTKTKHIITYCLSIDELAASIDNLITVTKILSDHFDNGLPKNVFDNRTVMDRVNFKKYELSKSMFKQIVADISYS